MSDHIHSHDEEHTYMHAHGLSHTHGHVHENQKAVINRLARAIGHLDKVKRMVEEGYDCSEVLVQLAAVRSALDNTGKVILKDHMRHCMVDAVTAGDEDAIDDLCQAIDKFMKEQRIPQPTVGGFLLCKQLISTGRRGICPRR